MDIKIDPCVLTNAGFDADYLRSIMLVIFEDYLAEITPEEFQKHFGNIGLNCLRKFSK